MMDRRIVVVEDEPSVQELLRDVLQPEGYTIVAYDHPAAVEQLDPATDPLLILIDLMLPDQSGIKLAGKLRTSGFKHTPIVAMSASKIMLHLAQESGLFQEVLAKPFDLSRLYQYVGYYAGRYVV